MHRGRSLLTGPGSRPVASSCPPAVLGFATYGDSWRYSPLGRKQAILYLLSRIERTDRGAVLGTESRLVLLGRFALPSLPGRITTKPSRPGPAACFGLNLNMHRDDSVSRGFRVQGSV